VVAVGGFLIRALVFLVTIPWACLELELELDRDGASELELIPEGNFRFASFDMSGPGMCLVVAVVVVFAFFDS
jgi:hypothetical protein